MRVMCGFKTDYKIETLMDNFEEMVTEIRRVDLAKNLEYAVCLQFMDRLEKWKNK